MYGEDRSLHLSLPPLKTLGNDPQARKDDRNRNSGAAPSSEAIDSVNIDSLFLHLARTLYWGGAKAYFLRSHLQRRYSFGNRLSFEKVLQLSFTKKSDNNRCYSLLLMKEESVRPDRHGGLVVKASAS